MSLELIFACEFNLACLSVGELIKHTYGLKGVEGVSDFGEVDYFCGGEVNG